ncbi:hypothetical protein V865_008594 [Kwoniella europaea PYCC6329]|uniref:Uncharacterized protein n=1 Tax=Kwoniella europaea PYCC6329 TaxID=1423913 RepID=A0AAX4KXE5_9TREE
MAGSRPEALRSYDIETRGVEAAEYHPSNGPLTNFAFGDMVTELGISGGKHDRIVTSKSGKRYQTSHLIKESRYAHKSKGDGTHWIESKGDKDLPTYYHSTSCTSKERLGWVSRETRDWKSKMTGGDAEMSKGWVGFHIVRPWSSTVEPYLTYWTEYKLPEEKVGSSAGSTLADSSGTTVTATDTDKGEITNEESGTVYITGTEEKR